MDSQDEREAEKPRPPKPPIVLPAGCEVLISIAQIADLLKVSTRQVQKMISAGEYPRCDVRIGRLMRWKVSTHNAWIESQCSKPKPNR